MENIKEKETLSKLMYALTKEAARSDFCEFLEDWDISEDEYDLLRAELKDAGIKTYC